MTTPSQPSPPFQFGLSSLLLITTLAAVVMSVSVMVPGIGIVLAIIATPALIRTYVLVQRSREDGKLASVQEKTLLFLACLGISALIALATGAAFFVTCLVGVFAGSAGKIDTSVTIGLIVGTLAGLIVLIPLMVNWFKRPTAERGNPLLKNLESTTAEPPPESDP